MMQTHPIDLVREQLALACFRFGQGLLGLATALALVGLMWASTLRPADAAGPSLATDISATAEAGGHLGVAAVRLQDSGLAEPGSPVTSAGVCRLELDLESEAPLAASCAPVLAPGLTLTN
jgi:hypothetical protein